MKLKNSALAWAELPIAIYQALVEELATLAVADRVALV